MARRRLDTVTDPQAGMFKDGEFIMIREWNFKTHRCMAFLFFATILGPVGLSGGDRKFNDDTGAAVQLNPSSAMGRGGTAVFVWEDARDGAVNVYGQRYTEKGFAAGANFRVTPAGWSTFQFNPDVAMSYRGHFAVVWDEKGRSGQDVYGKLFAANGTPIREEFEIAHAADISESTGSAGVAMDALGNFTVCWDWQKGHQSDIFIRQFDATGAALGPAKRINAQLTGYSKNPAIGMGLIGEFVVAWEDNLTGVTDIMAQRFDRSGNMVGGNFEVSDVAGQTEPAVEPSVAVDDGGHFCIAYVCQGPGALGPDIYAHDYYGEGTDKTVVVSDPSLEAEDRNPDIASFLNSHYVINYVIAWEAGVESDIFSRTVNDFGIPGPAPERVNEAPGMQKRPSVCYGERNTLFAWEDNRNGDTDIYAQWEGLRRPSHLSLGWGFDGLVPVSWYSMYGDDELISYKIYRWSTTSDSFAQTHFIPGHDKFSRIATVDARTRPYPRLMLDYIDRDVVDSRVYFYGVEAMVDDNDGFDHNQIPVFTSSGYSAVSKWAAAVPTIDGVISPGEWDGAAALSIWTNTQEHVTLYIMNDANSLYLAADDSNDAFVDPLNILGFMIDRDNSGSWDPAPPSDEGAFQIASTATAFTGYYGSYPDGFRMMSAALSPAGLQGAVSAASGHVQYEARLDIPAAAGSTVGFAAWVSDPGSAYPGLAGNAGEWPAGALWEAAETLGDLALAVNTEVEDHKTSAPEAFGLRQNFPNPFNPSTTIRFSAAKSCRVELKVFDLQGRELSVLMDGICPAGEHAVRFNAAGLPSGIYVCRIRMGDFKAAMKMAVVE
jgi:hypothetical protein